MACGLVRASRVRTHAKDAEEIERVPVAARGRGHARGEAESRATKEPKRRRRRRSASEQLMRLSEGESVRSGARAGVSGAGLADLACSRVRAR
eukprot:3577168-Pleurochrysis_carterae.AAC.1